MEINKQYQDSLGFGIYQLDPRFVSFYEFDRVMNSGVCNTFRVVCEGSIGTVLYACEHAAKTGKQLWIGAPTFFSCKESFSSYMEKFAKTYIDKIKEAGLIDAVVGFQWDEPLLKRDHSNEDFQLMTRALSEEYGKRIFPVFSTLELFGYKTNKEDPDSPVRALHYEDTKYITDVAFDVYGNDFRENVDEFQQKNYARYSAEYGVEIKNGKQLFNVYIEKMMEFMQSDPRIWFFPTAYCAPLVGGKRADEDFCIGHVKGLREVLLEQKKPGGLFCYTYKNWSMPAPGLGALESHFNPENPNRWNKLEETYKEICSEFNEIKIK